MCPSIFFATQPSYLPFLCDRNAPADAESFRRDPQTGGCLLPFVFAMLNHGNNVLDQVEIIAPMLGDLLRWTVVLYNVFENLVEHRIGWEGVAVELAGTQLRGRRFLDRRIRNNA